MSSIQIIMPKMGESIMEGTILKWLKKEGDHIDEDESILEIGTDKVDTEIPSIYNGKLKKILVHEGDIVQVGSPIAIIEIKKSVSNNEINQDSMKIVDNIFKDIEVKKEEGCNELRIEFAKYDGEIKLQTLIHI